MLGSIVSPLDGFRSPFGPQRGFNPATLFGTTDTGWLYDLSDMSTLFEEAAGITPVTAVNQPVGLCLDKSKGLVLGPELVTSTTPNATDWTNTTSGVTVTIGSVTWSAAASGARVDPASTGIVAGRYYRVVLNVSSISAGAIRLTDSSGTILHPDITSAGVATFYILAVSPVLRLRSVGATTTAVVTSLSVRELPGNHRSQSVSLNRPTLRQDTNGLYYLEYDGLNDSLSTTPFAWGSDKATVVAGVRKLSDAARAFIFETGAATPVQKLSLEGPTGVSANDYRFTTAGSTGASANAGNTFASPVSSVLTGIGDIANDVSIIRVNGVQTGQSTADQGTGIYANQVAFFGARSGSANFFNGREYSQFAINRLLTANELSQIERYTAQRTGVTIP